MEDCRLLRIILSGERKEGMRSQEGQAKRYKYNPKQDLERCGMDVDKLEPLAVNRTLWRSAVIAGATHIEDKRRADLHA